jgi:arylsulfatase A-like enzyme
MDVNQAFHHRKLNRGFWTTAPSQHEVIAAYDEGLKILDRQIGDLFGELARRRILNNSLVIITSDHGESFGAQSIHDHDPAGHGTSLYPEQTRVPLFVIYPDKIPNGRKVKLTVSLRDIPKTITQILSMGDSPFVGQALPITLESINALEHYGAHVLATLNYDNQEVQSVIMHPWQYIKNRKVPGNGEELYDLVEDPTAKKNLKANASLSRQFRALLQKLLNAEL